MTHGEITPCTILFPFLAYLAQKIASVEKKLDRLFFTALKEDRKQLRITILQVQELQQR